MRLRRLMCGKAMPCRGLGYNVGLRPWYGLGPESVGASPNHGPSPSIFIPGHGAAEPRRRSGGKAASHIGRQSHAADRAAKPRRTSGGRTTSHIGRQSPRRTSGGRTTPHIGRQSPRRTSGGKATPHIGRQSRVTDAEAIQHPGKCTKGMLISNTLSPFTIFTSFPSNATVPAPPLYCSEKFPSRRKRPSNV